MSIVTSCPRRTHYARIKYTLLTLCLVMPLVSACSFDLGGAADRALDKLDEELDDDDGAGRDEVGNENGESTPQRDEEVRDEQPREAEPRNEDESDRETVTNVRGEEEAQEEAPEDAGGQTRYDEGGSYWGGDESDEEEDEYEHDDYEDDDDAYRDDTAIEYDPCADDPDSQECFDWLNAMYDDADC